MSQNLISPRTDCEVVSNALLCSDHLRLIRSNLELLNGWRRGRLVVLAISVTLTLFGLGYSLHAQTCYMCVTTPPLVAATPLFSVPAGTYSSTQTISISDATQGATIYYTSDGSTPTTSSALYTGPITVSFSKTLQAIAVEIGYTNSPVAVASYTIGSGGCYMCRTTPALVAATPVFSIPAGTYSSAQTVSISDATQGATIYYTSDGSTPTIASTLYTSPITVSMTETIKAIAVVSGFANSQVASAMYSFPVVDLTWDAPASSPVPVTGYDIYRAVGGSSTFQLLNSFPDTETTYEDSTVQAGKSYTYYVESVDASGAQSVPSEQVSVSVP